MLEIVLVVSALVIFAGVALFVRWRTARKLRQQMHETGMRIATTAAFHKKAVELRERYGLPAQPKTGAYILEDGLDVATIIMREVHRRLGLNMYEMPEQERLISNAFGHAVCDGVSHLGRIEFSMMASLLVVRFERLPSGEPNGKHLAEAVLNAGQLYNSLLNSPSAQPVIESVARTTVDFVMAPSENRLECMAHLLSAIRTYCGHAKKGNCMTGSTSTPQELLPR